VLVTGLLVVVGLLALASSPGVPGRVVLEVDFEEGVIEALPDDPLAGLMLGDRPRLLDLVAAIDRAADDPRVVGLLARVGDGGIGMAQVQELRDAVARFRGSGKPSMAFAETFGEFGPGNGGYYLATAFDEVWMQPSGDLGLTGFVYESMFLAGTLDKLDVRAQFGQRREYKSAVEAYTESGYTGPAREALEAVIRSRFGQLVDGIAERRGLEPDAVRSAIDRAPLFGEEALTAGLVDGLDYYDAVRERIVGDDDPGTETLGLLDYLRRAGDAGQRGTRVALIHGYGAVARGASGYSPLGGEVVMGSETVAGAFRDAIDDDAVKAILFRVDSPGGSYVASDTIRHELTRARQVGKPVVVSMGDLAGSGGYFVAMAADRIVAQPSTITASIGVYGGKMVTRDLWARLGVTFDEVHRGRNARMFSDLHAYDAGEWRRVDAALDRIYADFTTKVADDRDLPLERVEEAAGGRIWTGEDAVELGLVDRLGGVREALDEVRDLLGLDPDAPLELRRFPAPRSAWSALVEGLGRGSADRAAIAGVAEALREAQPALRELRRLGLSGRRPGLRIPDVLESP